MLATGMIVFSPSRSDAMVIEMAERQLPPQFNDLDRFLAWALPTERERTARRQTVAMPEIRSFYDAMVPRLAEILKFLDDFVPEDIPSEVNRLFLLTMSLAEIAPAVENFGQPGVIDGYDYTRFIPVHD
jgi:hypothetical protein